MGVTRRTNNVGVQEGMLVSPEFLKVMHGIHLTSPSSWSGHGARSQLNVGRREVRDARCPRWVSIRDAASYIPDIRCRRGFSIGDNFRAESAVRN